MDEVDLAFAGQFRFDGALDQIFLEVARRRFGWRGDRCGGVSMTRHVAQADEGHVQRARDGRGADMVSTSTFLLHLFEALFVARRRSAALRRR